jgi:hypothetical protein
VWVAGAAAAAVVSVVVGLHLAHQERAEDGEQQAAQNEPPPEPPQPTPVPQPNPDKPPPDDHPKTEPEDPTTRSKDRQPVPDAEVLAGAEKELHERFKDLYAAKSPQLRTQLFRLVAREKVSPALRYVALKEVRDLSAQAGDVRQALQVAGRLGDQFAVNRLEVSSEAVRAAAAADLTAEQNQVVLDQGLWLIAQANAENEYALATQLAKAIRPAADKARNPALVAALTRLEGEAAAAVAAFPAVKKAQETLGKTPDDPAANATVGRFRCVYQDAWEEGLPLLARGDDEALKEQVAKDLAGAAEPAARKEVGDGWWALGDKEKDAAQQAFSRRAYHWYALAAPKLTGGQTVVKERMEILTQEMPDLLDPWRHLDTREAKIDGDHLHLDPYKCVFTRRWYRAGVDITVVARTAKNNIRLTAGPGGVVTFNESTGGGRCCRPDNPAADGRGGSAGSSAGGQPRRLEANKYYTLRWRLGPTGMQVSVDGEQVFAEEQPYDLTAPRPVGVCSFDSPLDVKSVVVQTLKGEGPGR